MLKRTRWGIGLTGAVVLALGLGVTGVRGRDHVAFVQRDASLVWAERIARVDEALGRSDLSQAIYQWREAYGAAVRSGRSEGLIAVGDRALRLAALSPGSGYFVREASYVYLYAAHRAHTERSRDTILGIAERFEKLGDTERAEQVRRIAEHQP